MPWTKEPTRSKRVIYEADPNSTWYTPPAIVGLAIEVLRSIFLDPCTSDRNPTGAAVFLTAEIDALATSWPAPQQGIPATAWCNPPYGKGIDLWLELLAQWRAQALATHPEAATLALVPSRPGSRWYARATQAADIVCELRGRPTFWLEGPDRSFAPAQHPARWGCTLLYSGPDRVRVLRRLRAVGAARYGTRRPTAPARPAAPRTDDRQVELFPALLPPQAAAETLDHAWPANVTSIDHKPRRVSARAKR